MNDLSQSTDAVQVEVTLTVDGDWRADPLKLISGLQQGSRGLDRWQRKAVKAARKQGYSWEEIAAAFGVSRQAAWERFSKA
jgi:DNA-directed RNA polymerase specialized sigma24 family protein